MVCELLVSPMFPPWRLMSCLVLCQFRVLTMKLWCGNRNLRNTVGLRWLTDIRYAWCPLFIRLFWVVPLVSMNMKRFNIYFCSLYAAYQCRHNSLDISLTWDFRLLSVMFSGCSRCAPEVSCTRMWYLVHQVFLWFSLQHPCNWYAHFLSGQYTLHFMSAKWFLLLARKKCGWPSCNQLFLQ